LGEYSNKLGSVIENQREDSTHQWITWLRPLAEPKLRCKWWKCELHFISWKTMYCQKWVRLWKLGRILIQRKFGWKFEQGDLRPVFAFEYWPNLPLELYFKRLLP
jgi:hypothetical protein